MNTWHAYWSALQRVAVGCSVLQWMYIRDQPQKSRTLPPHKPDSPPNLGSDMWGGRVRDFPPTLGSDGGRVGALVGWHPPHPGLGQVGGESSWPPHMPDSPTTLGCALEITSTWQVHNTFHEQHPYTTRCGPGHWWQRQASLATLGTPHLGRGCV